MSCVEIQTEASRQRINTSIILSTNIAPRVDLIDTSALSFKYVTFINSEILPGKILFRPIVSVRDLNILKKEGLGCGIRYERRRAKRTAPATTIG